MNIREHRLGGKKVSSFEPQQVVELFPRLAYTPPEWGAIHLEGISHIAVLSTQSKEKVLRIYVGNLPYQTTEEELQEAFGAHGQVESATVIRDQRTSRSKGFAFVEMPSSEEAQAAIEALNGKEFNERTLTVNEARPREERGFGGGRQGSRW